MLSIQTTSVPTVSRFTQAMLVLTKGYLLFHLSSFPFKACLVFSPEYNSGLKSTQAAVPAIPSITHSPFKSSLQKPNAQADPSPMRPEFLRAGLRHGSCTKLPTGLRCAARAQHHASIWALPSCLASERHKDWKSLDSPSSVFKDPQEHRFSSLCIGITR